MPILSVEVCDDVARIHFFSGIRKAVGGAALLRFARARTRSLTMLSMQWISAIVVLTVTASALGLFADPNIETSVLFAGLVAILGILTIAVLLLAEIVDAVQALARDRSAKHNNESDKRYDNAVALEPHARHLRMVIAAVESVSRSKALGGAITTGNLAIERRCKFTSVHAIGSNVDIVITSDRRK